MVKRVIRGVAVPFILSFVAAIGLAQEAAEKPKFEIHPVSEEIHIDGALNEAVWQHSPTFTLDFETEPGDNIAAPVKTEMWITHDHSHLYVAVRAHDPHPEQIRARLTDRDSAFQDDFAGVALDTFNDQRRAFEFFANPYGVQMDLLMNDVTGNEDQSWDAIWNSAGRITATGYEIEMAIPFSSLRFPPSNGTLVWGIDALRIWPRDQRYRLGLFKLPRGRNCYLCYESKISGFDGIKPGRNLEFDPTVTANRTDARDTPSQSFQNDNNAEPGLTTRWGVTPGLTLNGTLNPDFSQVEADAAQLTVNTQFAIFYPEKRPFFLEGADLFDTKIQAIYTRDIADPSWGVKLSGKEGKSAFGAIIARDDFTNFIFPASQSTNLGSIPEANTSTILRYRYDLGSGSTIGGLFTSREGDNYHNRVFGADSLMRWGSEAVRIEFLGSSTEYPAGIQQAFDQPSDTLTSTAMRAVYEHQTQRWTGYIQYMGAGDDFRADLGFIPQVGYHKGYGFTEGYWYSNNNDRWWQKVTMGAETTWLYQRNGDPLQQQVSPYFLLNGRRELFSNLYVALGPYYYNGVRFDRNFVNWRVELRPSGSLFFAVETRAGQEIDYDNTRQGSIFRISPEVRFDLGRHLRLQLTQSFERLNVDEGRLFHANVSDVRMTYQINARTFVRVTSQYFDVNRNPELYTFDIASRDQALFNQFLFSYKVNPQVVLFLGYSDSYNNGPVYSLSQANRTLFFKVGYAFVL